MNAKSILIILFCALAQSIIAKPRITEVRFYGYENPNHDSVALYSSSNCSRQKYCPPELFNFELLDSLSDQRKEERNLTLSIHYKSGKTRIIQVFQEEKKIIIREGNTWLKVPQENEDEFSWFLTLCIYKYQKEYNKRLSPKQLFASQRMEDSLLIHVQNFLLNHGILKWPNGSSTEKIAATGSGLIYLHLSLFDKYYNFKRIREEITKSFQTLARNLKEYGISVELAYSGIKYKPLFKIMQEDDKWICYVGTDIDTGYWTEPIQMFNEIEKNDR